MRTSPILKIFVIAAISFLSCLIIPSISKAGLVGNTNQAVLSLSPATGSYEVGQEFEVNIYVDTDEKNVVVVAAYLFYDKNHFQAISIEDVSNSVFAMQVEASIDSTEGKIKITRGSPTPGVKTSKGLVATIKFRATSAVSPSSDNLTFDFQAGKTTESNVILDDGLGTDILTGAYNAKYTVTGTGGDLTPPSISSISVSSITYSGAVIKWTTNEPATSQVEYGKTVSYGSQSSFDSSLVTSHSVSLSGLSEGTIYHYRIKTKDAAGNLGTSGDRTFTTLSSQAPPSQPSQPSQPTTPTTPPAEEETSSGENPPLISGTIVKEIGKTSAVVSWQTDQAADSLVEYGLNSDYGLTVSDDSLVRNHSLSLSDLLPGTLYHFKVRSQTAEGDWAETKDLTFTTIGYQVEIQIINPADGQPLVGAEVVSAGPPEVIKVTDQEGRVVLDNLPPGQQWVLVKHSFTSQNFPLEVLREDELQQFEIEFKPNPFKKFFYLFILLAALLAFVLFRYFKRKKALAA